MHSTTHSSPLLEWIQREGFTASRLLSFWGGVCCYITLWPHQVSQSDCKSVQPSSPLCNRDSNVPFHAQFGEKFLERIKLTVLYGGQFFCIYHLFIYWLLWRCHGRSYRFHVHFRLRWFNMASACSLCVCVLWWTVDLGWIPTSQTVSAGMIIVVLIYGTVNSVSLSQWIPILRRFVGLRDP